MSTSTEARTPVPPNGPAPVSPVVGNAFSTPRKTISRSNSRDPPNFILTTPPIVQRELQQNGGTTDKTGVIIIPRGTVVGGGVTGSGVGGVMSGTTAVTTTTTTTQLKDATGIISTPLKFAGRRTRPLSRDSSKETLQVLLPIGDALSASTSTSSLTTTSIYHSSAPSPQLHSTSLLQPHPPTQHATLISTTTSYTHVEGGEGAGSMTTTKLPSVTQPTTAASLTATLLAAAKESQTPAVVNLPALVSAHQARIAALESLTCSQGDSIVELRQMVKNLQKQLVFVMASVPSTSGTGGVQGLTPQKPSSSSAQAAAAARNGSDGTQPHRSRSSTELRYARAQKRLSGGSTPQTPGMQTDSIVSQLHFGAHTDSMDSLPGTLGGNAQTARSARSRPGSKTNSRYSSPRGNYQQQQPQSKGTSHHFSFHPSISSQPPPGQISVEPFAMHSPKATRPAQNAAAGQHQPAQASNRNRVTHASSPSTVPEGRRSRRLTPVEGFGGTGVAKDGGEAGGTSTTTATISIGHAHATISATTYPHSQQQLQQQAQYPFQPIHHHPSGSTSHSPQMDLSAGGFPSYVPNTAIQSLDTLRPIPVSHTVTHSKHGVTEYVLSFRDGEDGGGPTGGTSGGGPDEYNYLQDPSMHGAHADGPSPRSLAFERWKVEHQAQQNATSNTMGQGRGNSPPPPPYTKEGKKKKKAKKDRDSIPYDSQDYPAAPSSPRRFEDVPAAASEGGGKKTRKVKSEKKLCKVAGCGESRIGDQKYCKVHGGPAPLNPNARKMMFQH